MSDQSLIALDVGARVRVVGIAGGRSLARRLLALGIRPGVELEVLFRRGRGVVVSCASARVALGGGMAEQVRVAPLASAPVSGSSGTEAPAGG